MGERDLSNLKSLKVYIKSKILAPQDSGKLHLRQSQIQFLLRM